MIGSFWVDISRIKEDVVIFVIKKTDIITSHLPLSLLYSLMGRYNILVDIWMTSTGYKYFKYTI